MRYNTTIQKKRADKIIKKESTFSLIFNDIKHNSSK